MKTIKILGPGCGRCRSAYQNALEAVKQAGSDASVIKVEDIEEMMRYNILSTPALVVDEKVMIKGRVPEVKEIIAMLQ